MTIGWTYQKLGDISGASTLENTEVSSIHQFMYSCVDLDNNLLLVNACFSQCVEDQYQQGAY
jgi:hypothetical protein